MTRKKQVMVLQILIFISFFMTALVTVAIAQISPETMVEGAKAVGEMNVQHLLAAVCIALCLMNFYLVRTLITMAKKPCVYMAKND